MMRICRPILDRFVHVPLSLIPSYGSSVPARHTKPRSLASLSFHAASFVTFDGLAIDRQKNLGRAIASTAVPDTA
jgi:hypothetical protein